MAIFIVFILLFRAMNVEFPCLSRSFIDVY